MMFWFFILILAATLGATVTAGILTPNKKYAIRVVSVIITIALFIICSAFFWKHAIVALAIAAVCSLAIGVMFQKVDPSKAIKGALVAFILMFFFTWLAFEIAAPLFFDRESSLSLWFTNTVSGFRSSTDHDAGVPGLLTALGAACLLSACFLERWIKAVAVFIGALLLALYTPIALKQHGIYITDFFYSHDPVFNLIVLLVIAIGIGGFTRLLMNNKNSKSP